MSKLFHTDIEKAALHYATHASKAPDKETPDWIITDFKAGAKWQQKRENKELQDAKKLLERVTNNRRYMSVRLRREILDFLGLPF